MKRLLLVLPAMVVAGSFSKSVSADHPALTDTHYFTLGAYSQKADTKVASTRDGAVEQEIDLGNLDVDDSYLSWTAAYRWRFAERWSLSVLAYTFNTDGSTVVSDAFEFDGQEFEVGASLETEFSMDALLVDVFYSAYRSDRAELQLGVGLHAFDFDVSFDASVFAGEAQASASSAGDDVLAPLPNVRAKGMFAFTPKWAIYGGIGWLSATVDDYEGRYLFGSVKTDYRVTDSFSVGVGYEIVDVDLTYAPSSREVVFDVQFYGPTAFVSYSF